MVPEGQDQDDDEEIEEEIEKQPLDLEDMLELFREPEEPPRKGFNPMWLVLALVVLVGGCWLAVTGVQAFVEQMTSLQGRAPKSGKTGERAPEAAVTDVQANYRARCAKGMTKDEIRWIIGDFRKARLGEGAESLTAEIQGIFDRSGGPEVWNTKDDDDPLPIGPDQIAELRAMSLQLAKAQQDWYVEGLADGLRLDAEQIARAKQRGREFIAEKEGDFLEYRAALWSANFGVGDSAGVMHDSVLSGRWKGIHYVFPESGLLVPDYWLRNEANAPWERCDLRPEQRAVTVDPDVRERSELNLPDFWVDAGELLPFTPDQHFPDLDRKMAEDEKLKFMLKLHPAQFRLLLLLEPDLADEIEGVLNDE